MSWPLVKLKDVCTIVGGATPKRNVPKYWAKDVPWVTPKDISKIGTPTLADAPEYISDEGFKSCSAQMLPKNSILVTSRAPIGNIAIAGREMCTNQGFKSLVPGPEVDTNYLYHCMVFYSPRLQALGNGATFKEVSKKIVENFKIPLPPLNEQKRIAAILDKADGLRRKREKAIGLTDTLLRAVFLDMFGDPVTNPMGWEKRSLSEIGQIITGSTPSRENPDYYGNSIEWIKSDNINTPSHYVTVAKEYLSEKGLKVGRSVPSGSLLVTCIAGSKDCIGNIAIADREVAFNQQINAISPNKEVSMFFLYAQLAFNKNLVQRASTNSMKGMVSKSKFSEIKIIVPPLAQQEAYSHRFQAIISQGLKSEHSYEQVQCLSGSLTQRAFRGELLAEELV